MKLYKNLKRRIRRMRGCEEVVRQGFWFVDIPRTSSTSIRVELGKRFSPVYGKFNVIEKKHATKQILKDHQPAQKMADLIGRERWDKLFTFTMVRDPWDRVYSMFNYRKKRGEIPEFWSFREYMLRLAASVQNLENEGVASGPFRYHATRCSAAYYLLGEDGEMMVDYVAKYENRANDLAVIASRLKIDHLGDLTVQSASPQSKHYSEFYDEETQDIVRRLYSDDIKLFEYEFES